ncbi:hypothetical protein CIB95_07875 [Lottiidibacillus patelloidae]|uniref:Uncharacterized protein n=1 Tax=Lottiidibacillus patelloidae TaxID=2670334 RepID=A0A263BUI0_9BACI|nr:hypothetical protein [Lottiidibacillus patelloidae]OZM57370.1 hypothetical protein CIB95_07875 [Lottiidibacillus patelloidae]
MISLIDGMSEKVKAPRTLMTGYKLGRPCGEPFDLETRKKVVKEMLDVSKEKSGAIINLS